jgi:hypothetical protein
MPRSASPMEGHAASLGGGASATGYARGYYGSPSRRGTSSRAGTVSEAGRSSGAVHFGGGCNSGAAPSQHWQDAFLELEQETRNAQADLRKTSEDTNALQREAQQLREEIEAEQAGRQERVAVLSKQVEELERESKQMTMKLLKVQMQDSAKLSDVTTVKKDVVARTMELEKVLREFQQTHQDKLFSRVLAVTGAMLNTCQRPDLQLQILDPVTEDELQPTMTTGSRLQQSPAANGEGLAGSLTGAFLDPETQQALKRRLQSLGDVVVYSSDKHEACCASGRSIPPGALRVRPRRCDHIFLVECLMPHWAEGLCPVCRCSFAYDRPIDASFDDADRYSSVSTSVSQAVPRPHMFRSSSAASDGGSVRGSTRGFRGRSASLPRSLRRNRSPAAADARSEASRRGMEFDRLSSLSPARSVASSSLPVRDGDLGGLAATSPKAASVQGAASPGRPL